MYLWETVSSIETVFFIIQLTNTIKLHSVILKYNLNKEIKMTDKKEPNYKAMWMLGLVMIPLGVILLYLGPKKAPLGIILIGLSCFYIITAIRKKKKKDTDQKE